MSWEAETWARSQRTGDPVTKAILVAIANWMNARGDWCFVSTRRVADETEVSPRTVQRHIVRLESLGLVEKRMRHHANGSQAENEFRFPTYRAPRVSHVSPPGQIDTPTPGQNDVGGGDKLTPPHDTADTPRIKTDTLPQEAIASSPPGAGTRASRIPADWVAPPIADLPPKAKAMAEQWPDGAYEAEAEAHHNFWLSEGGARARKVDWGRAWSNRIVQISSAVQRAAKAGVRYPAAPKAANTDWLARARMAEMRAETYEMMHRTEEAAEQRAAAQRFVQMAASPGLAAQPPPLRIGAAS